MFKQANAINQNTLKVWVCK